MTKMNKFNFRSLKISPKYCVITFVLLNSFFTTTAHSVTHKTYTYEDGKTYLVNTALGIATQIVVGKDEKILDFGTGFSAGWELVRRDNVFYVKPKDVDAETNMYIRTDKRSYVLDLRLVSKEWKKIDDAKTAGVNYVVQFNYAESLSMQTSASGTKGQDFTNRTQDLSSDVTPTNISNEPVGRKNYFTNYETASDISARWLVPVRVYDDGVFTYLQFADGVNSPAVFARSSVRDQEYVVNKTVGSDTLQVVHGLHPVLVIRHGDSVVAVRRKD